MAKNRNHDHHRRQSRRRHQNSVTAGRARPAPDADYQLLEKLAHQNRERIPERTVPRQRLGGLRHIDHHARHHALHQSQRIRQIGSKPKPSSVSPPWRRTRRGRRRARRAGFRVEVLHRPRQLDLWATTRRCSSCATLKVPDFIHTQKAAPSPTPQPTRHVGFLVALTRVAFIKSPSLCPTAGCPRVCAT